MGAGASTRLICPGGGASGSDFTRVGAAVFEDLGVDGGGGMLLEAAALGARVWAMEGV